MKRLLPFTLVLALIIGLTLVGACEEDRDDSLTAPQIRVQNKDTLLFSTVSLGDDFVEFMEVDAGGYSNYVPAAEMPFFSTIEVEALGETYTLEAALDGYPATLPLGFYTYALSINSEGELVLDFIID